MKGKEIQDLDFVNCIIKTHFPMILFCLNIWNNFDNPSPHIQLLATLKSNLMMMRMLLKTNPKNRQKVESARFYSDSHTEEISME